MTQPGSRDELVNRIYALMDRAEFQQAGSLCETVTSGHPDFAEGWVAAAEFFLRVANPGRALELAQRAVELNPRSIDWLLLRARCFVECSRGEDARADIADAAARPALSPHQHNEIGMLLARVDEHTAAQQHYRLAVAAIPGEVEFLFNLATSLRFLGEVAEAERVLDRILSADPTDHEAAAMRSSLRKQTADNNHVTALKQTLESGLADRAARVSFSYALAKELEDLGNYRESFSYLKRGADLRRSGMRYDVATDVEIIGQIMRVFDREFFATKSPGHPCSEPIFVIGLPRSGTTLTERILGAHSAVHAAGELGHFGIELTKLTRRALDGKAAGRTAFVSASAKIDFAELGRNYIQSTKPLAGATSHFTDKLPFNYLYAGLIHRALPGARIISVRRHPMDSCYSMYKQLFRDAYPFSYDLADLAEYYLAYHALMQHWHTLMPDAIHTVQYENLVTDTEGETRKLLAFCGLDWEAECLEFHKSRAASTTASATQVRQRIYASSVGRWRAFEPELLPLRRRLEAAGILIE